ncbi:MAG TPA: MarR family transcriptional regulator [Candidatus Saccharimonadales bacterium]
MVKRSSGESLYWNLLQVSMRAKKSLAKLAESNHLNIMQLYVLCSMEHGKVVPTHFVSSLLTCDASTVTGIVDCLAEKGLVARAESPQDRRVKFLSLTDEGEAMKRAILKNMQTFESAALDGLGVVQKGQLQTLLAVILEPHAYSTWHS